MNKEIKQIEILIDKFKDDLNNIINDNNKICFSSVFVYKHEDDKFTRSANILNTSSNGVTLTESAMKSSGQTTTKLSKCNEANIKN